jgi:hypothetical protein
MILYMWFLTAIIIFLFFVWFLTENLLRLQFFTLRSLIFTRLFISLWRSILLFADPRTAMHLNVNLFLRSYFSLSSSHYTIKLIIIIFFIIMSNVMFSWNSIFTVFTSVTYTKRGTCNSTLETFTVFLLTSRFFAMTALCMKSFFLLNFRFESVWVSIYYSINS